MASCDLVRCDELLCAEPTRCAHLLSPSARPSLVDQPWYLLRSRLLSEALERYYAASVEAKDTARAVQVNLRVTFEEEGCIEAAADALGLYKSTLVERAVTQQIIDLGMYLGNDTPPAIRQGYVWPFLPQRRDGESAKARVTAHLPSDVYPMVESASWALRTTLPLFAIGATLRHVANLKVINEARQAAEPKKYLPALKAVAVPYGFDELVRSNRR